MQFLTGFDQEKHQKSHKKAKKRSKLVSTKICKKSPLAISEMLSQTLIAARSQHLKITTQTQKTKKPKNKNQRSRLRIKFSQKMKNLVVKNKTIQKLNHARYFSIKKFPGPTNVCSTKERRSRSRIKKLVKIKKVKNQLLLHLTKEC